MREIHLSREGGMIMPATGRCLCAAVEFTVESFETEHHVCHCRRCRRWVGGPAFGTIASGVTFKGEEHLGRWGSSSWAERGFCTRGGSSLFWYLKPKAIYVMCVGAFDDPAPFTAVTEIYVDAQPPGYALAGRLERLTERQTLARFAG
jgi:hypothetical protein